MQVCDRRWLLWCVSVLLLHGTSPIVAQHIKVLPDQGEEQALADQLMQGLAEQRALLKSGQFKLEGTIQPEWRAGLKPTVEFSCQAECYFADGFQQFRFDQRVSQIPLNLPQQKAPLVELSQYIRTPEFSIHTAGNNTDVRIFEPDHPPRETLLGPFDIRVVGLISGSELQTGMSASETRRFLSGVLESYRGYQLETVRLLEDRLYEVTWRFGKKAEFRLVLQIDAARGYAPVKLEYYHKRGQAKQFSDGRVSRVTVRWERKSQVWVPISLQSESRQGTQRMELKFVWKSVNEQIPASVFTLDGLDLPEGRRLKDNNGNSGLLETSIIDHRGGKKTLIRGGDFRPDEE